MDSLRRWGLAVLGTVLTGAFVYGAIRIRDEVHSDEKFFLDTWQLDFGEFPRWMTPEIRRDVMSIQVTPEDDLLLFEKGVLVRLKRALERSCWIEKATNVALTYPTSTDPGTIRATLELRYPVAVVELGGLFYLTDADGRRLGETYDRSPAGWFGVPLLFGAQGEVAVPESGGFWEAKDIFEGLAVADVLFREGIHADFPDTPIDAIDIHNVGGRFRRDEGDIVLHCAGRKLVWGRSPISERSRTISTADLLENLRDALRHLPESEYRVARLYFRRAVYDKEG